MAIGVLLATFGTVKFLDLNAMTNDAPAAMASAADSISAVSAPLDLPARQPLLSSAEPETVAPKPANTSTAPVVLPLLPTGPARSTTLPLPEAPPQAEAQPQPVAQASGITEAPIALHVAKVAPSILETSVTVVTPEPAAEVAPPAIPDREASDSTLVDTAVEAAPRWVEHTVASGDSLARIFSSHNLEPALLHRIVNSSKAAKTLGRIRPGQTLRFRFDDTDELTGLEHHRSRVEQLHIAISDEDVKVELVSKAVDTRTASAAGVIESSLFVDGQKAGLSDAKVMELAEIFGWDIDFALELRAGDQFRVVWEEQLLDGEKLRDGPILAAEFTNRGNTFRALRYKNQHGEIGYFDATGHSKRRAFLRTPIKFARISSRYNPKRWHPVLKRWRSHKGVDYAAPTGTPIKASGDGKVLFRGTKGGYGRTVILQHAGKYTTLYAHMSKYSKRAKSGARVKQGQVIGYVGKTGLASGPHLHYEFRVNGRHKDPLRVKLPKSLSLPKQEIAAFKKATAPLLSQLDAVPTETMVASVDADKPN